MATNISVFDLDNYPSNPKTVTIDLTELVPFGNNGEDTWVISAVTSATASGGVAIQRIYLRHLRLGWAKSSGLNAGPYNITITKRHLKVAIDEDIGSGAEIALDVNALPLGGDAVAINMQAKINALASSGGAKAGNLSYLNAVVVFENGVFKIVSGTASSLYAGTGKSSVAVADGTTTTGLAAELGFDMPTTSEVLASTQVKQTSLSSEYVSGTSLVVASPTAVATGDCVAVTDGVTTEYRGVECAVGGNVTLSSGMANGYAAGSLVQVLRMQDSSGEPPPIYSALDDVVKFALSSIANQINFAA